MPTYPIPYKETGYFSKIILDYLSEKAELQPFYGHFPTLENFGKQIPQKHFSQQDRLILSQALRHQYAHLSPSLGTMANITALENDNTFTVTTGHQLNLFTGPLYFLLKIIDTIALSRKLANKYPGNYFVPVYWMATEDHDFDEIDHFWINGKKIAWEREAGGPVGRFSTEGLVKVLRRLEDELGSGENAGIIKALFTEAYLKNDTLANATRFLADRMFGEYGLVIVDGDDAALKKMFAPILRNEIETQFSYHAVNETSEKLGYPPQVHARELNLFYMKDGLRERLERNGSEFSVVNTEISFSQAGILAEIDQAPQNFSPNVILRPLYQETVLPNLCYIGGGGEIAYWLQLKAMFDEAGVAFPILMLRDSVMLASQKHDKKRQALKLEWHELFAPDESLAAIVARKHSELPLDFTPQREALASQFEALLKMAEKTHPSFLGAVKAQQARQLKGLDNLEKKLIRAEKKNLDEIINRAIALRAELFPGGGLQERKANFAEFYLPWGDHLIQKLLAELDPLEPKFRVIVP